LKECSLAIYIMAFLSNNSNILTPPFSRDLGGNTYQYESNKSGGGKRRRTSSKRTKRRRHKHSKKQQTKRWFGLF